MKTFLSALGVLALGACGFVLGVVAKTRSDGSVDDHDCCECLNPKK